MIKDADLIPEPLREALRNYAAVQMQIAEDPKVREAQFQLHKVMEHYQDRLNDLAKYIKAHVLELENSVSVYGVTVSHRSEYDRVMWSSEDLNALYEIEENQALLDPARSVKTYKPSVTLKYKPVEET
jgi:hypothetical protein